MLYKEDGVEGSEEGERERERMGKEAVIAMVPFPMHGHVTPFLAVAQELASPPHSLPIVVVLTHHLLSRVSPAFSNPNIRLLAVPDGPPADFPCALSSLQNSLLTMRSMQPFVHRLLETDQQCVGCLILDTFVTWGPDIAGSLRIPFFNFFTAGGHSCNVLLHAAYLKSLTKYPFQVENGEIVSPNDIIDCIPGAPPLCIRDFTTSMIFNPQFCLEQYAHIKDAQGILLNTFYELESEPLEAINKVVPIYPTGFFHLLFSKQKELDSELANTWQEDMDCLQFLNSFPASSVLYASFGSISTMGDTQVRELAEGLDCSKRPFLWVVRPDSVTASFKEVLKEEGFFERIKGRGMIVSWAPQLKVLSHASVGGFLSHCGWNSFTENLSIRGLPMICWPQLAEQRLNCRIIVDDWKVGMELKPQEEGGAGNHGLVRREEVARVVRALMQEGEEEANNLRKRMSELAARARKAVEEGGSSQTYFHAFVQALKKTTLLP